MYGGNGLITKAQCYNFNMIPAKLSLVCPQGTTFKKTFTMFNPDGTDMDLTGYSSVMEARKSHGSKTALFTISTDDSISITNNEITVDIHHLQTAQFPKGDYVWDIEITSAMDERSRILEGVFIVTPEVTK